MGRLQAEGERETDDRVLCHVVGGHTGSGDQPPEGGRVHDVSGPLPDHQRVGCRDAVNHPLEIHIDDPLPVLWEHVPGLPPQPDAGVVEEIVEPSVFRKGLLDELVDILFHGDVQPGRDGLAARP